MEINESDRGGQGVAIQLDKIVCSKDAVCQLSLKGKSIPQRLS